MFNVPGYDPEHQINQTLKNTTPKLNRFRFPSHVGIPGKEVTDELENRDIDRGQTEGHGFQKIVNSRV